MEKMDLVISYCFSCICDRYKATSKKYTLNERKFHTFYAKILKDSMIKHSETIKLT